MRIFRSTLLCLVGAVVLVAGACTPPPTPGDSNVAPIAAIGASPTSGDAPLPVTFSAEGSTDPDGSIVEYRWDFGDGSPVVVDTTGDDVTHTYSGGGTFTATLTVKDDGGKINFETVQITVTALNQAPTAVIDRDISSGKAPLTVSFTGSGSTDADGTIESYSWEFGDGATSTEADPQHTYTEAGLYTAQLTVTDDGGATGTATVTITADANQPPTAVASGDPTVGKVPLPVQFSSDGSTDADGTITAYSWDFGDGSAASTEANPSHTYADPGDYLATLTVTDDSGSTATDTVSISVNANQPPVAVANATPTAGQEPLTVNFTGSDSTDPDGEIVSYLWDFGDGNSSANADPEYTFSNPGSYTASLTVTDDDGATGTDQVTITVSEIPNVPPTAAVAADPVSGKEPLTVNFSSAGSGDSDGTIVSYDWDFGDGGTSTQADPSHVYSAAGDYVATLTVTDDAGATDSATVEIAVTPNQLPQAFADASPFTLKEGGSVQFFSAGSNDPDGQIESYLWDFGDGQTSTAANPSHVYGTPGTYAVSLTVTDDNGATASDEDGIVITVIANQAPVAAANATPQSGPRELQVTFSASGSDDPDGDIVSYSWDFGDGSAVSTDQGPVHVYTEAGTFTATLTVTDDNGVTDTDTVVITVIVDDDGDGFSPPQDCDDTDPAINPDAPDTLGDNVDSNCDGGDGVVADQTYVSSGGGSDSSACGTIDQPCATIGAALGRAQSTSTDVVVVAGGTYPRFSVVDGLDVRGGFGQNFLRGSAADGSTVATVNGSFDAGFGASAAVIADGITTPTLVSDLRAVGADESANSRASYGVIVRNSTSALTLDTLTVIGGVGGAGTAGSNGSSATQSPAAGGGNGQNGEDGVSVCNTSRRSGGSAASGAGAGGAGGSQDTNCSGWPWEYDWSATPGLSGGNASVLGTGCGRGGSGGGVGNNGAPGQTGCVTNGSGGSAGSASNGAISGGLWTRSGGNGGSGSLGQNGTGGGGGGGGGGADSGIDDRGAGGGGGGAGGARATVAGTGGSAGHASIAVLVSGSSANLVNLDVTLGTGGNGGQGGSGGLGQPGGAGGAGGARHQDGGAGGNGGSGGRGGHSGAGGGGAGGPSFGIVSSGSTASITGATYTGGSGGAGGAGGSNGITGATGQTGPRADSVTL